MTQFQQPAVTTELNNSMPNSNAADLELVSEPSSTGTIQSEDVPHDCVLIVGAGPVGLVLATVLSRYGVRSILLEKNETTTK